MCVPTNHIKYVCVFIVGISLPEVIYEYLITSCLTM